MQQQEFRVGHVLGRTFEVFFKNFAPFVLLALIMHLPVALYTADVVRGGTSEEALGAWSLVNGLGGTLLSFLTIAVIMYGTIEQLRGRQAGLRESIVVGLGRLFPVLGVAIVTMLCIGVFLLTPALLGSRSGMALMVIPAAIVTITLYVAVPAAVVERVGIIGALKRSVKLTSGYRWHILGIVLVLTLVIGPIDLTLEREILGEEPGPGDRQTYMAVAFLLGVVVSTLKAVSAAVVYHDLRAVKEGVDAEELARVFE